MTTYGIIRNGELVRVSKGYPGAKPVVYEVVPPFDQTTHYVVQKPPVDKGDYISMGIEIHEMEQQDEGDGEPE